MNHDQQWHERAHYRGECSDRFNRPACGNALSQHQQRDKHRRYQAQPAHCYVEKYITQYQPVADQEQVVDQTAANPYRRQELAPRQPGFFLVALLENTAEA